MPFNTPESVKVSTNLLLLKITAIVLVSFYVVGCIPPKHYIQKGVDINNRTETARLVTDTFNKSGIWGTSPNVMVTEMDGKSLYDGLSGSHPDSLYIKKGYHEIKLRYLHYGTSNLCLWLEAEGGASYIIRSKYIKGGFIQMRIADLRNGKEVGGICGSEKS